MFYRVWEQIYLKQHHRFDQSQKISQTNRIQTFEVLKAIERLLQQTIDNDDDAYWREKSVSLIDRNGSIQEASRKKTPTRRINGASDRESSQQIDTFKTKKTKINNSNRNFIHQVRTLFFPHFHRRRREGGEEKKNAFSAFLKVYLSVADHWRPNRITSEENRILFIDLAYFCVHDFAALLTFSIFKSKRLTYVERTISKYIYVYSMSFSVSFCLLGVK